MWQTRWEESLGENGYMFKCGWIPSLFTWNFHNIVCKSAIPQCFANKGLYSQNYGFSCNHVQIWELDHQESWAPKTDAFELWCWRRIPRVLWTAWRSNQSIRKENNSEYSLEGLMLKLPSRCEELTHWKRPWCWERLRARGERGDRGEDGWMASSTQWTWVWANSGRWWSTGNTVCYSPHRYRVRHHLATEQQQYPNTK